jgi:hypothetical protein
VARGSAGKRSPWRVISQRQLVFGLLLTALGAASFWLGAWSMGLPLIVFGGLVAGLGALLWLSADVVPVVNTAYNAVLEGRIADAERLLDQAEAHFQLGYIRRIIDLQRANIAMRRGDLDAALARVEAALARPVRLLTAAQERSHLTGARAMRALIRASRGDREGARADVAAVRADPEAPAEALARAEVAEAVALERSGDRDALAAHLAAKRTLLLDATAPRERAVVRAYQRMLKASRTSVYRRGATHEAEEAAGSEPTVASFIAKVAPAAAPFARAARATSIATEVPSAEAPEEAIEPGLLRVAEARLAHRGGKAPGRQRAGLAALWVLILVLVTALWQLLSIESERVASAPFRLPDVDIGTLTGILFLILTGVTVGMTRRNLKHDRRLAEALGALARGDPRAEAKLRLVARSSYALAASQAHLHLARLAVRRADFARALRRCDKGIAVVTARAATRTQASSILLPDLVAERAFVLAATDRHADASAEMAALREAFPAYPYLARAELRVALVQRARRGDVSGAARLVAESSDEVPLPLRDETLADLVRAAAHPESAGAGEVERLKEELRVDGALRVWLEKVAPAAVAAFERPAVVAEECEAEGEREAEAEREAAEALRVEARVARG